MTRRIVPSDGQSHVVGPTDRPLIDATIPAFLKEVVRRHGDRECAVFPAARVRWTYDSLSRRVDRLAAGLLSLGLYRGDRVGIWAPNRPEWLIVQYATARIGIILVNINPACQADEVAYALNQTGATALIMAPGVRASNYVEIMQELAPELASCPPGRLKSALLPHLRTIIQMSDHAAPGMYNFDEVMSRGGGGHRWRLDAISARLSPGEVVNIQFTSGTTGAPKGAMQTHRGLLNNAINGARALRFSPGEGVCVPVPLYHVFGTVMGSLAPVAYGLKMVFPSEAFEPRMTLEAIENERCSIVHGVPTMFQAMLDHPDFDRFDLRSIRTGGTGGAPCPISLMRRIMKDMHCRELSILYGMTETSGITFQTAIDDTLERRVTTIGRVQPHVEARVVDRDGKTLPAGEQGELLIRGYLVMKGYWNDPERSAEAIRDGWLHTGDLAAIDAKGYCQITGRSKDMVIRGGENVYPAEIENFLLIHSEIAAAQVFGVPDKLMGEEVCAWLVPRSSNLSEQAVLDHCRGNISHFKVPRHIRFVEEFPMTITGKPQKFIMRERMMSELGLKEAQTA
jgi:fatty-acyl-CoA synthase